MHFAISSRCPSTSFMAGISILLMTTVAFSLPYPTEDNDDSVIIEAIEAVDEKIPPRVFDVPRHASVIELNPKSAILAEQQATPAVEVNSRAALPVEKEATTPGDAPDNTGGAVISYPTIIGKADSSVPEILYVEPGYKIMNSTVTRSVSVPVEERLSSKATEVLLSLNDGPANETATEAIPVEGKATPMTPDAQLPVDAMATPLGSDNGNVTVKALDGQVPVDGMANAPGSDDGNASVKSPDGQVPVEGMATAPSSEDENVMVQSPDEQDRAEETATAASSGHGVSEGKAIGGHDSVIGTPSSDNGDLAFKAVDLLLNGPGKSLNLTLPEAFALIAAMDKVLNIFTSALDAQVERISSGASQKS